MYASCEESSRDKLIFFFFLPPLLIPCALISSPVMPLFYIPPCPAPLLVLGHPKKA